VLPRDEAPVTPKAKKAKTGPWSAEDDEKLKEEFKLHGVRVTKYSDYFENKSA